MLVPVQWPACRSWHKTENETLGRVVACPLCGERFVAGGPELDDGLPETVKVPPRPGG